jgi:predicted enzyme related to lactoylglutathione lyase
VTKLVHFTLAAVDVGAAKDFYNGVFGDEFSEVDLGGQTLYCGSLAGLGMVICPTQMADVVANRSRHQFQLEVDDVVAHVERATSSGGRIHTQPMDTGGRDYAVICDPDDNTIELIGTDLE